MRGRNRLRARTTGPAGKGFAELDALIAKVRGMAQAIGDNMDAVVDAVEKFARSELDGGHGIGSTEQWPLRKDGRRALVNASKNLIVRASGRSITLAIPPPYVYHQFGAGRVPFRPLLPKAGLPFKLGDAIADGLVTGLDMMDGEKKMQVRVNNRVDTLLAAKGDKDAIRRVQRRERSRIRNKRRSKIRAERELGQSLETTFDPEKRRELQIRRRLHQLGLQRGERHEYTAMGMEVAWSKKSESFINKHASERVKHFLNVKRVWAKQKAKVPLTVADKKLLQDWEKERVDETSRKRKWEATRGARYRQGIAKGNQMTAESLARKLKVRPWLRA